MSKPSDEKNPFNELEYELKEIEINRQNEEERLGVFVKASSKDGQGQPYVVRIDEGSPAAKTAVELKEGDFVLSVNGRRVETKAQMAEEIERVRIGQIKLVIARRRPQPIDTLVDRPLDAAPKSGQCTPDQPSFRLDRVSLVVGLPSAGVPQTPPELKKMLSNRVSTIMEKIRAACSVKVPPKSQPNKKSPPPSPPSPPGPNSNSGEGNPKSD